MDGIQGQVSHSYVLVYTFAFYPTQKMAGYATAPAISGWGLVILALMMIVSGLTLHRRGPSFAWSG